ncbi:MAG: hypothetical protein DRI69_11670 [Bacteroidetes bacterium]|nr:MAG: hypothetical protein DRI69_11670 [Bacteroidota bacterium]
MLHSAPPVQARIIGHPPHSAPQSYPRVRNNHINKNDCWAVRVCDRGGGTIEDNNLRINAGGAWSISADSELNLRRARNKE